MLALARWPEPDKPPLRLKSVLLSADCAARSLVRTIEASWRCRVFDHYGMTEMGLGGGIDCRARAGYHLRENDLYFEVVDPATGRPVPEGESGEVVFTTLNRLGMPLIRYRTGDISRFLPEPCSCGSGLRRLDYIGGRADAVLRSAAQSVPDVVRTGRGAVLPFPESLILQCAPTLRTGRRSWTFACLQPAAGRRRKRRRGDSWAKNGAAFAVRAEVCDGSLRGYRSKRKIEWVEA